MKRFQVETNSNEIQCAREILDAIPLLMRTVRSILRKRPGRGLSIPEFRTLAFLIHNPDSALAPLAEHLGLTPPTASKLVDGLVKRGLLSRESAAADRRRLVLRATARGGAAFKAIRGKIEQAIAALIQGLPRNDLSEMCRIMRDIRGRMAAPISGNGK